MLKFSGFLLGIAVLTLFWSQELQADSYPTNTEPEPDGNGESTTGKGSEIDPETTTTAVATVQSTSDLCAKVLSSYQIDCIAEGLEQALKKLPKNSEYDAARVALGNASRSLRVISRENADPAQIPQKFDDTASSGAKNSRYLTPVNPEALESALDQAAKALEEAETLLLRSAESSEIRSVAYQQIAEAIGSNKVLLRSSTRRA